MQIGRAILTKGASGHRRSRSGGAPAALKVSIVVPAYNDERYIERSLGSCFAQTHDDIEVVCVDDGSTDGTLSVLRQMAASEPRLKLVALESNTGTHNARRAGLDQASGDLVMFLDADDELDARTCECAVAEYRRKRFDILHFASRVTGDGRASRERVKRLTDWMCPVKGELRGRDIARESFVNHAYSFSVACKAYPLELVKRAFAQIGDPWVDSGEDALEYFAIAVQAATYRGLVKRPYYIYHLGDGLSERQGMTREDFERVLRLRDAVEAIRVFLDSTGKLEEYREVYQAHFDDQLKVTLDAWNDDLIDADKPSCLRHILQIWPRQQVLDAVLKLGVAPLDTLRSVWDGKLVLTEQQLICCGQAEGARRVREEYESSPSYRIGRALSKPVRKVLGR